MSSASRLLIASWHCFVSTILEEANSVNVNKRPVAVNYWKGSFSNLKQLGQVHPLKLPCSSLKSCLMAEVDAIKTDEIIRGIQCLHLPRWDILFDSLAFRLLSCSQIKSNVCNIRSVGQVSRLTKSLNWPADPGATMTFVAGGALKPIGGHILSHASATRIFLRKGQMDWHRVGLLRIVCNLIIESGRAEERVAKLVDSPDRPESEASYKLDEGGWADVWMLLVCPYCVSF